MSRKEGPADLSVTLTSGARHEKSFSELLAGGATAVAAVVALQHAGQGDLYNGPDSRDPIASDKPP